MENFIVSARKYRPLAFDSVVGQEAITSTLKNAILNRHLAQAYLFCGPRGVGKTTCARIFARSINCENTGENAEPCNVCESCRAFGESRSYNIHELDAASNNSVDDIRNLTDQVRIPPQVGKYSTYIIDEVHMLSASAFNSFLKTLEEPPPHAVFILATTEKQKIIPTILSRCQIFDFHRIGVQDIVDRLLYVAGEEGVEAEPEALNVIARKADGAMRDALSIFDQIVSYSGKKVTYKDVIGNLNVLDYDYYFRVTSAFLRNDFVESLMIFNEILENGFDGHHFITGLSSHFRDLLVCRDPATLQLLEVGASIRDNYLTQSKQCTPDFLYSALDVCSTSDIQYKSSNNQRLHVELTLLKLSRILLPPEGKRESKSRSGAVPAGDTSPVNTPAAKSPSGEPGKKIPPKEAAGRKETKKETESGGISGQEEAGAGEAGSDAETPEPKAEEQKPVYRPVTTSIKDAMNGLSGREEILEEEQPGADTGTVNNEGETGQEMEFNMDLLMDKWILFAENIKKDKPRLATTLKSQLPLLKDNFRVEVEMLNAAQKEDFDRVIKTDLQQFLQSELNNNAITISSHIPEEEKTENQLYTDEEKFRHLNQVNPNLGKLKQQFNLDFE